LNLLSHPRVSLSETGLYYCAGDWDIGKALVRNSFTGQTIFETAVVGKPESFAITPDASKLWIVYPVRIEVWAVATGEQLCASIVPPTVIRSIRYFCLSNSFLWFVSNRTLMRAWIAEGAITIETVAHNVAHATVDPLTDFVTFVEFSEAGYMPVGPVPVLRWPVPPPAPVAREFGLNPCIHLSISRDPKTYGLGYVGPKTGRLFGTQTNERDELDVEVFVDGPDTPDSTEVIAMSADESTLIAIGPDRITVAHTWRRKLGWALSDPAVDAALRTDGDEWWVRAVGLVLATSSLFN